MTGVPSPTVPERVLDALGDTFAARAGDLLDPLVEGLTSELEATDALLRPYYTDGRYATVFDLEHTPQPAWLGAAIGTAVPGGLTVEEQRVFVRDQANWRRGNLDAIAAAVRMLLTGGKHVAFIERARHSGDTDHPWRLALRVMASETAATEDELLAAANTQKPVGMIIESVELVEALTYGALSTVYDDYGDFGDEFASYADFVPTTDLPGARWHRPPAEVQRYARTRAEAATYTARLALYPEYRDARDAREDNA